MYSGNGLPIFSSGVLLSCRSQVHHHFLCVTGKKGVGERKYPKSWELVVDFDHRVHCEVAHDAVIVPFHHEPAGPHGDVLPHRAVETDTYVISIKFTTRG